VFIFTRVSVSGSKVAVMSLSDACRLHDTIENVILLTYAVISYLRSLARYRSTAYLSPLASNTLLVPSRLAFLQRSASARSACGLANACALVYVAA